MSRHIRVTSWAVLPAIILWGLGVTGCTTAPQRKTTCRIESTIAGLDESMAAEKEEKTVAELQLAAREVIARTVDVALSSDLTQIQLLDYGWAQLVLDRPQCAQTAFIAAAGAAPRKREKVRCIVLAAQAAHRAGENRSAGKLANAAARFAPASRELAALRVAYWTKAEDQLELAAAEQALKACGIESAGTEVLEPGTVVLCVIVSGLVVSYVVAREHRGKILPVLLKTATLAAMVAANMPGA